MKKILVSLVLVSLVFITGCGSKNNELLGTWDGVTDDNLATTFKFEKNGKISYNNGFGISSDGTYKINGENVTIKLKNWSKEKVYKFEVKENKLSLTSVNNDGSPNYKNMTKK